MNLYTSYFALQAKINPQDKLLVSIAAAGVPKWFPLPCCVYPPLAPSWDLVADKNQIDWSEYERRYRQEKDFGSKRLHYIVDLMKLSQQHGDKDLILLCFEKAEANCHRHLVAKELNGIEIR